MKKMIKAISLSLVLTIIISFLPHNTFASQISNLEDKQQGLEENIKKQQELIDKANEAIKVTKTELSVLDDELQEARNNLITIKSNLDEANSKLNETIRQLDEIQLQYEVELENFKERLKVMYEFGDVGYIEVLLGSKNIADFFNRLEYVNAIANHDKKIVDELLELEASIQVKLAEVEREKMEVEKLLVKQTDVTKSLNSKRESKASLISTLHSNVEQYNSKIAELEKSSKEIEDMIKKIQAANSGNKVYYTGGKIKWPVPSDGRITSDYGYRIHPITGVKTFHKGIDIPANSGAQIVAAESGKVITAAYINGYGNTVVIDHGKGMSTLYAHNSSLKVKSGQEVTKGDVVALAGSTGFSTGPHLHFEVRLNGATVDPKQYLGTRN